MARLSSKLKELVRMKPGQTAAEYALILAAVATILLAGYQTMGATLQNLLTVVDNHL